MSEPTTTCKRGHPQFPGSRYENGHCKECRRASNRAWRKANPEKAKAAQARWREANPETARECGLAAESRYRERGNRHVNLVRALLACEDCGSGGSLQFHHHDPASKTFDLSDAWRHPEGAVFAELAKCGLVCKPCHVLRHRRGDLHGIYPALGLVPSPWDFGDTEKAS